MSHANARTDRVCPELIVARVLAGHRPGEVAKQLGVSRQTVYKWVRRCRPRASAGLADRSSRPHRSRGRTPRGSRRGSWRPGSRARRAGRWPDCWACRPPRSGRCCAAADAPAGRLWTGSPANSRAAAGHRRPLRTRRVPASCCTSTSRSSAGSPTAAAGACTAAASMTRGRGVGWDCHVAIDDRTRLAYAEVLPDEWAATCAAFLHRAAKWFRDAHGVTIERVRPTTPRTTAAARLDRSLHRAADPARFIQARCPWTNGKAERFNRTLQTEWAYAQPGPQRPAHRRPGQLPRALQHSTRPLRPRRPTPVSRLAA